MGSLRWTARISLSSLRTACGDSFVCADREQARQVLNMRCMVVAVALVSRAWGANGFATVNGDTTGGEGGVVVTVTNSADFIQYATRVGPHIIRVQGTIAFGTAAIKSHKTIVGIGANPTLRGELQISGVSN